MTIKDIIAEYESEAADVEIYESICSDEYYRGIHTDFITSIYDNDLPDEAFNLEPLDWSYMDEEEYDNTVLANSGLFHRDMYNATDKILVIVLPSYWRDVLEFSEDEN